MARPDPSELHQKNERLQAVAAQLKDVFVGIDGMIDQLIDAMRVWYVMPEALTRPVIVNLWGMTGVGKTDLVRRLVKALELQDRFLEIELTNSDRSHLSVTSALSGNGLDDPAPKVVLFDEVQRFSTINQKGEPITMTAYADFWELLSDGRLSRRNRQDLDFLLAELLVKQRRRKPDDDGEAIDVWDAQEIKRALGMDEELADVAAMSHDRLVATLRGATSAKRVFEPVDHSKTLIIVSGNLDDAFSMAGQTAEADIDADIFHAFTEKVNLVDVKQALSRRFTPEQVARFGNIHLIYRSLKREHFEKLIEREVERNVETAADMFGIELTVTQAIHELVYRNGVFPTQGARPVFSSVADILESNLARFVLDALMNGETVLAIDYDVGAQELVATFSGRLGPPGPSKPGENSAAKRETRCAYSGRLDQARSGKADDLLANVAVHEAGHAVAYGALFGLAPLQLTARVASTFAAGFTFPHEVHSTKESILFRIQVYLAGGLAEELVFGPERASTGRQADRESATALALDFVRRYGFHERFEANYALDDAHSMNKDVTDLEVEATVARMADATRSLLASHKAVLMALSRELLLQGRLNAAQVAACCGAKGLEVVVRPEGHQVLPPYGDVLRGAD